MTFIDRKTTKAAQQARKGLKGKRPSERRAEGFETPDRPGTNLAWSNTGKRPEDAPRGNSVGALIREAQQAQQVREVKPDRSRAAMMRRIAEGGSK